MSKLQAGDRAEITIVGNVTAVRGRYVELDNQVYLHTDTPGLKFRRLSRPKPKQGAVLTGREIQQTWWRRGTIFRLVESEAGHPVKNQSGLVLLADGNLRSLDAGITGDLVTFQFDDLAPDAKFELRFVA